MHQLFVELTEKTMRIHVDTLTSCEERKVLECTDTCRYLSQDHKHIIISLEYPLDCLVALHSLRRLAREFNVCM